MPVGPRGEKRPADLIGCAVKVARIATGEADDDDKSPSLQKRIGSEAGGRVRAERLGEDRRSEISRTAAAARWKVKEAV